jgi:hypothetical protein
MSRKSKTLGLTWIGIFVFTIAAFISLIFALIQNDVVFLEKGEWENDDTAAKPRIYFIAVLTMVFCLLSSSYGSWRQCLSSHGMSSFDELTANLVSVNGALCFCCFILFINFKVSYKMVIMS